MSPFTIRPATTAASDPQLLVDFQDSQISWLSSMGSGGQWGTQSVRNDPARSAKTRGWVTLSERNAPWNGGSAEWCRAYVAEASDGTPVAGLVLDNHAPAYVRSVLPEQDERDPFVYLAYVISDRNVPQGKGSGAALIAFAKEQTRDAGVKRLCLDCWRGNDGKLVRYYESQGFVVVGSYDVPVPEKEDWLGCVLEIRL
ncbi:hypothetical protein P7C73_g1589, partial [Tremellales sp. Uapishka_1]